MDISLDRLWNGPGLPPVCVRTGRPATAVVRAVARPADEHDWWWVFGGPLAWWLRRQRDHAVVVSLPVAWPVTVLRSALRAVRIALVLVAVLANVLADGVAWPHGDLVTLGCVVAYVLLLLAEGTVFPTPVLRGSTLRFPAHPAFVAAYEALAAQPSPHERPRVAFEPPTRW